MKIVLQRVREASIKVDGEVISRIGRGYCLLVGVERGDDRRAADYLAGKIIGLRIFPDDKGKMNLSLSEVEGEILAVSQFTLAASLRKGRRPGFDRAEDPIKAESLFQYFIGILRKSGCFVQTGRFGAEMEVGLINDGPVTFILDRGRESESE